MNPMGISPQKEANDCLPNGRFDTTPREIIRAGPCLIDGNNMFRSVQEITKVTGNFANMFSASYMFHDCGALTSFSAGLPALQSAYSMFNSSSVVSFHAATPSLSTGNYMFCNCNSLTFFEAELLSLRDGDYMFNHTGLTSFNLELPWLINGSYMFYECASLSSFKSSLPYLMDGAAMFCNCTSLVSFGVLNSGVELPTLRNGDNMFHGCAALTVRYYFLLPLITSSVSMFEGCEMLSVAVEMPRLIDGTAMFNGCRSLNSPNLSNTIESLPTYNDGSYHEIGFVGVPALTQAYINLAAAKGWTVKGTPSS